MVVPLVALAVVALVVIKSLMGVVAHDQGAPAGRSSPTDSPAFSAGDDRRTLLLPAATDHVADPVAESNVF